MNKRVKKIIASLSIVMLFIMLALVSLTSGGITGAFAADTEVSSDVADAFDQGTEPVSVIVLLKEDIDDLKNPEKQKEVVKEKQEEVLAELSQEERKTIFGSTKEKEFELKYQYETLPAIAGELSEEGLKKLRRDPNVEKIVVNKVRQLFLSGSVPVVNADDAWNVVVNGYNLTGQGETVCVVDTGVDYNHTALSSNYLAGFDFYNNDSDPFDDQGHGTHVAGIVASTDATYRGVAPGAKIVAVKVCSALGSCPDADVLAGMDWCLANKDVYNVSVVSISLGGGQYASYCDNEVDFAPYAAVINDAASKNISVVAATGNSGAGSMAGPACIQNVTRVTSTTKSDALPGYASRHSFFNDTLAAPGSAITSLDDGGGTVTMSGTSMAAPHVSGAIVLIKQYWKQLYGKTPTPEQIEQKIINSGKAVYDSSTDINYARVDILSALQPVLSFTDAPSDGSVLNSSEAAFVVFADVGLIQAWMEWIYPDNATQNFTLAKVNVSSAGFSSSTEFSFILSNLSKGRHTYRVYGSDAGGMTGATAWHSLVVDNTAPSIFLLAPSENATLGGEYYNFTAEVDDEHSSLSSVWFNISDGNNSFWFSALQNNTLPDNALQTSSGAINNNAVDGNADNNATNNTMNSSGRIWVAQVNLSKLADGAYTVTVHANDSLSNENKTMPIAFTIGIKPGERFLNVNLIQPVTGNVYKNEVVAFNVSINSSYDHSSVAINITNGINIFENTSENHSENNSGNISKNVIFTAFQDNSSAWIALVNMSLLAEGNHTAVIIAKGLPGDQNDTVYLNDTVFVLFSIDRASPLLINLTEAGVNESSAKIQWSTDEAADAKVRYGVSIALGTEVAAPGNDSNVHEIVLMDLAASTSYFYSVASCDLVDNCNASELRNFTTSAAISPPVNNSGPSNDSDENSSDDSTGDGANDDSGNSEGSSDSGSSSGSSSSGGSSGGGSSGSSSSSSSSSNTEGLVESETEVEEIEKISDILESTELQVAQESNLGSNSIEQTAEDSLTVAAVVENDADAEGSLGNLLTGFVSAAVFDSLSTKEYLLAGLTGLSVILTIAFIMIRRRANEF